MTIKRTPLPERFWAKVEQTATCWLWTAATDQNGYGRVGRGGKYGGMALAPRVSWQIHFGDIPQGMLVCHRCDNPLCVNPDHLFVGTQKDNLADCKRKGRHNRGNPKLSESDVREIRARCGAGEKQCVVAKSFGISGGHISEIVRRMKWTSLKS